jgi:hypothetical protein
MFFFKINDKFVLLSHKTEQTNFENKSQTIVFF